MPFYAICTRVERVVQEFYFIDSRYCYAQEIRFLIAVKKYHCRVRGGKSISMIYRLILMLSLECLELKGER